ncbi:MAG: SCP2 sterol-binding domain-containing protein [Gammaproteobacteria bacterium]|nr:SCP2 sterol-binding domain-containing protein [Gammaproteobacteria bacterium]
MLLLESVINHYLALDPEIQEKLAALKGKVIKLELIGINKTLYMLPNETGMQVMTECDEAADTVLRGTPLSLFKMGMVSNVASLLLTGEVEISGDTKLGHQFKNIFSSMDIDWSEPLAKIMGDGLAYQICQSGKKIGSWGKDTIKSVTTSFSEYLQEESRDVATETELDIFYKQVDQLRDNVDRLQAKVTSIAGLRADSNHK